MNSRTVDLEKFLADLAIGAKPGDRLPTIRDLMRRFRLSQTVVHRTIQELKGRGLVDSRVGHGTFFVAAATSVADAPVSRPEAIGAPQQRSILLLRRSISLARGRVLIERLHQRFADDGHQVLEVSYSDPNHASAILKRLPHFDACVMQSTFRPITIQLLTALHEKTDVVAVDGTQLAGADIESVGTEWAEPLAAAALKLRRSGHRKLAFAATSRSLLANDLAHRRWDYLPQSFPDLALETIRVASLPDDAGYMQELITALAGRQDARGRLPFSGLIAWGIEDGARFRQLMLDQGISIPEDLSVVLLGRTDLPNESGGFFDVVGCSVEDQVETIYQAIVRRWSDPGRPFAVHLTPVRQSRGASISKPGGAPEPTEQKSTATPVES